MMVENLKIEKIDLYWQTILFHILAYFGTKLLSVVQYPPLGSQSFLVHAANRLRIFLILF